MSIAILIGRALSRSSRSPAIMGERQAEFAAEIRTELAPFSQHGELEEEVVASEAVFGSAISTTTSMPSGSATAAPASKQDQQTPGAGY